ncbi:MAG: pseudouridine synthase [Bacteroidota bacterium]
MTSRADRWLHDKPLSRAVRVLLPYSNTLRFKPKAEEHGKLVTDVFHARFPFKSKKEWEQRLEKGWIYIEGQRNSPHPRVELHDVLVHHHPRVVEPSVPDEVEVLDETPDWLAIFKPAPLPMHPGGRFNKNTITRILEEWGYEDLRIIHRLDSVTSGIVLFAKHKPFAKRAMQSFQDDIVQKTYWAVVSGNPKEGEHTVSSYIRRTEGFVFGSYSDPKEGKHATTHFTVLQHWDGYALVECTPVTGRTHQIRLHLKDWGHPIVDDQIYGHNGDLSSKTPQNTGIRLLHKQLVIDDLDISIDLGHHP